MHKVYIQIPKSGSAALVVVQPLSEESQDMDVTRLRMVNWRSTELQVRFVRNGGKMSQWTYPLPLEIKNPEASQHTQHILSPIPKISMGKSDLWQEFATPSPTSSRNGAKLFRTKRVIKIGGKDERVEYKTPFSSAPVSGVSDKWVNVFTAWLPTKGAISHLGIVMAGSNQFHFITAAESQMNKTTFTFTYDPKSKTGVWMDVESEEMR